MLATSCAEQLSLHLNAVVLLSLGMKLLDVLFNDSGLFCDFSAKVFWDVTTSDTVYVENIRLRSNSVLCPNALNVDALLSNYFLKLTFDFNPSIYHTKG